MSTSKIFLVDDHKLLLSSMKVMLEKEKKFTVVGEAYNGKDFLTKLEKIDIDVVLMDIDMPEMTGIEAAKRAFCIKPELKIITVSMFDDFDNYNHVIEAGIHGFVIKNSNKEELINAIYAVLNNEKYFSPPLLENAINYMSQQRDKHRIKHLLSERELEVLQLICNGLSNNDIANYLNISHRTVEKHRNSLIKKTKSKNSVALAVFATTHNLIKTNSNDN